MTYVPQQVQIQNTTVNDDYMTVCKERGLDWYVLACIYMYFVQLFASSINCDLYNVDVCTTSTLYIRTRMTFDFARGQRSYTYLLHGRRESLGRRLYPTQR